AMRGTYSALSRPAIWPALALSVVAAKTGRASSPISEPKSEISSPVRIRRKSALRQNAIDALDMCTPAGAVNEREGGQNAGGRELVYLPVGFGAHHWRAVDGAGTAYFLALHDLGADTESERIRPVFPTTCARLNTPQRTRPSHINSSCASSRQRARRRVGYAN